MRILSVTLFLTLTLNLFGQSNQCALLKSASISYCKHDYKATLDILIKFKHDFPTYILIDEVKQQIAHLYFLNNDFNKAKVELEQIITGENSSQNNNEYDALECKTNYDSLNFNCLRIVFPEPYIHLQYWSALDLYEIYLKENNFNKALSYLKAADNKYVFNYRCGNGYMQNRIEMALRYGQLYKNMNMPDSALKELLPYSFENYLADNSEATKLAISIIKVDYKINDIRGQFSKAIENIEFKKITQNDGQTNFKYYIYFMGNKIDIASPYWPHKEFSKVEMQNQLRNSLFYKQLQD